VYVLVRKDLTPAQQIVQSCHAVAEAARSFLEAGQEHPHLIVCEVRDEPTLYQFLDKLNRHGVRFRAFLEPDRGNELTALATEPVINDTRRLFRRLRLLCPRPQTAPLADQDFIHP
jgi:hypothetical protein